MKPVFVRRLFGVAAFAAFLMVGCGGEKLLPVEGNVTAADKSLEKGNVTFHPDADKGNKKALAQLPIGNVTSGKYSIATGGKPGAPAGRYK